MKEHRARWGGAKLSKTGLPNLTPTIIFYVYQFFDFDFDFETRMGGETSIGVKSLQNRIA